MVSYKHKLNWWTSWSTKNSKSSFYLPSFKNKLRKLSRLTLLFILLPASFSFAQEKIIEQTHQRIISAGGSITEILYAIGLGEQIIAVDSSSLYPPTATKLPKIGYFRSLGAEGLLSLSPDLLVTARGAGPDAVLNQVANANVSVKQFEQSNYNLETWQTLMTDIGNFFNRQAESKSLVNEVLKNIQKGQLSKTYSNKTINAIALLNSGQRGTTVAGKDTMPDLLFNLAGINNLASNQEGFKPFSTELLASNKIDLILIPSHNLESMGGAKGICNLTAIKYATINGCNLAIMDPLLLLGFGSRIDQAVIQVINQANSL